MSDDELCDALGKIAVDAAFNNEHVGLAILAMPEMEAIRTHLFFTHVIAPSGLPRDPALLRRIMAGCGLSESVIDWVLGGPS